MDKLRTLPLFLAPHMGKLLWFYPALTVCWSAIYFTPGALHFPMALVLVPTSIMFFAALLLSIAGRLSPASPNERRGYLAAYIGFQATFIGYLLLLLACLSVPYMLVQVVF